MSNECKTSLECQLECTQSGSFTLESTNVVERDTGPTEPDPRQALSLLSSLSALTGLLINSLISTVFSLVSSKDSAVRPVKQALKIDVF